MVVCDDFQLDKFKNELIVLFPSKENLRYYFHMWAVFLGKEDTGCQHTLFLGVIPNLELKELE